MSFFEKKHQQFIHSIICFLLRKSCNTLAMKTLVLSSQHARSQEREDIGRPRKKLRGATNSLVVSTFDIVTSLVENGIKSFTSSNFCEAETCFAQALRHLDNDDHLCDSRKRMIGTVHDPPTDDIASATQSINFDIVANLSMNGGRKNCSLKSDDLTPSKSSLSMVESYEYDEGMDMYQEPESVNNLIDDDSVSARLLYNIGLIKVKQNHYEAALSFFERTLTMINSPCQANAQLELQVLHKMGYVHYRISDTPKATERYLQAMALAVRASLDKSAVAAALNCLGVVHFHSQAADTARAMQLFTRSLAYYRTSLGSKPKHIASVLNNIGRVHFLRSEYDKAVQVYAEALSIRTEVLGPDSLDVAATTYNTGQTYQKLGRLDDALECYERFLKVIHKRLGGDSRDAAIAYRCMGEIYHEKGEIQRAFGLFKDALRAGKASLTTFHPSVASTLNMLGNLCYEMKDQTAALRYYREGLEVEQVVLPPEHPHVIITLTNIGHILKQRREYAEALEAYRLVHQKQCTVLGPANIELASTLSSIGLVQYHLKMYDEALVSYQEALGIRRLTFGTDEHPDIASTLNSIGLVLFQQNFHELAKDCFERSLKVRIKVLGKNHHDTAILWYNLATIQVS